MKKHFFPVFLDISEKQILVVGGGVIATRRIHTLLEFSSDIVVLAPNISKELEGLVKSEKITWIQDVYAQNYIYNKDMVIAATDNVEVNHQVYRDCKALECQSNIKILTSVVDDKDLCDYYFPSIVKNEKVVIGINSGGASPKETKQIRKQIESLLNSESIYEEN